MSEFKNFTLILLLVFATGTLRAQKYNQFYPGQLTLIESEIFNKWELIKIL